MARYIDVEKAVHLINVYAKALDSDYDYDDCKVVINGIKEIISVILPSVDAVEIVRCKDCYKRGTYHCPMWLISEKNPLVSHDRAYCSYGERRTDNDV